MSVIRTASLAAVDGDLERIAHQAHLLVAEPPQALDEAATASIDIRPSLAG